MNGTIKPEGGFCLEDRVRCDVRRTWAGRKGRAAAGSHAGPPSADDAAAGRGAICRHQLDFGSLLNLWTGANGAGAAARSCIYCSVMAMAPRAAPLKRTRRVLMDRLAIAKDTDPVSSDTRQPRPDQAAAPDAPGSGRFVNRPARSGLRAGMPQGGFADRSAFGGRCCPLWQTGLQAALYRRPVDQSWASCRGRVRAAAPGPAWRAARQGL